MAPPGNGVDYLLVIVMENHGLNSIIGSSSAPYLNQLANSYSLLTQYSFVTNPSLPNYLALLAGSTFACGGYDGNPNTNTCTNNAWASTNLVDSLEAKGYSWRAYMEDMPSNCYNQNSGSYYVRHNPFEYFNDINNTSRCSLIVPAGTNDTTVLNDLQSVSTSSNFMWLTPNGCNDMHDCSVSIGDNYLKGLVPQILNSMLFKTQKAGLFITFDEGDSSSSNSYVYTVWAGPAAKQKYESSNPYNHYSLLKTLEATWSLASLPQEDTSATSMTEVLSSYSSPTIPPSSIPVTIILVIAAVIATAFTATVAITVRRTQRRP